MLAVPCCVAALAKSALSESRTHLLALPLITQVPCEKHHKMITYSNDSEFQQALNDCTINFDLPLAIHGSEKALAAMTSEPLSTTLKTYRANFPKQQNARTTSCLNSPIHAGAGDKLASKLFQDFAPQESHSVLSSAEATSKSVGGIGSMIFLRGYMETHRGVSYEAVHQGTLYAQHTGQIFIYTISGSSFIDWCMKQSGKRPEEVEESRVVASLRAGKVEVNDEVVQMHHGMMTGSSLYWIPAGWLVARKADNSTAVALRKSFVMVSEAAKREHMSFLSLTPTKDDRSTQIRAVIEEIVNLASLKKPKEEDQPSSDNIVAGAICHDPNMDRPEKEKKKENEEDTGNGKVEGSKDKGNSDKDQEEMGMGASTAEDASTPAAGPLVAEAAEGGSVGMQMPDGGTSSSSEAPPRGTLEAVFGMGAKAPAAAKSRGAPKRSSK